MKDLTKIDGVDVIERQEVIVPDDDPAVIALRMKPGTKITTVHQVLLADERVIMQCMHPLGPDCEYTAATLRSVTAHQRTHGAKAMSKRADAAIAEATARATAAETELAERKQRRSDGSKQAAITRRQKVHAPTEIGSSKTNQAHREPIGDVDIAKAAQNVITAFNAMQTCADEFQKVLIGYMRLAQTASETPAIDPQIIAKASEYDKLQAAFKLLNSSK